MRTPLLCLLVAYPICAGALPAQKDFPPLLVESQETAAALEAAPEHLRADAGVYVLTSMGYRRVRESRNGFNCLIERDLPGAFEPRCFDAEGSATLLPVIFYRAEQRARGATRAYIERQVKERFEKGEFIAPRRVGICYMLSTRNAVVDNGKVARVGPRLLFYAPHLSNADLGTTPDLESRMLVVDEDSATAMIVVPVSSARRTRINYLSPDDMSPLTQSQDETVADSDPRDALGGQKEIRCSLNQAETCRLDKPDKSPAPR
ncbi:MAG TPA: hypothetical protein VFP37_10195 [Steroidobacteraceae bacterium]|nr:hypothetical protein [Steroidobacteraceae bacterium]